MHRIIDRYFVTTFSADCYVIDTEKTIQWSTEPFTTIFEDSKQHLNHNSELLKNIVILKKNAWKHFKTFYSIKKKKKKGEKGYWGGKKSATNTRVQMMLKIHRKSI